MLLELRPSRHAGRGGFAAGTLLTLRTLAQGHALFTRAAGSSQPCPAIDFTGGFNTYFAAAYGLEHTADAIKNEFGRAFDPFKDDESFTVAMWSLEELGATGNKVRTRVCSYISSL